MQDITVQLPQGAQATNCKETGHTSWVKKSGVHVEAESELTRKMGEALMTAKKRPRKHKHRRKHIAMLACQRIHLSKHTTVAGKTL